MNAVDGYYEDATAMANAEARDRKNAGPDKSLKNLGAMFDHYAGKGKEQMDFDATQAWCNDLKVELDDVVILAVAELTKAPTMGYFDRKPWVDGWKGARKDTIELQRSHLDVLRKQLGSDEDYFRKVYNFCFDYAKESGQKSLGEWAVTAFRSDGHSAGMQTLGTVIDTLARRRIFIIYTAILQNDSTGHRGWSLASPFRFGATEHLCVRLCVQPKQPRATIRVSRSIRRLSQDREEREIRLEGCMATRRLIQADSILTPALPLVPCPGPVIGYGAEVCICEQSRMIHRAKRPVYLQFLDFTTNTDPAFEKYDLDAAWPSLIDEFVEHVKERLASGQGLKSSTPMEE